MNTENRNVPLISDIEEEKFVIGCLLIDKTAYSIASQHLDEKCFYNDKCKSIWAAIDTMGKDGTPIDLITVSAELLKNKSKVSAIDLVDITAKVASTVGMEYHVLRLVDLSRRRQMWLIGQKLSSVGLSEEISTSEAHQQAIDGINEVFEKAEGVCTLKDSIASLNSIITLNQQHGGVTTGTKTGFEQFDSKGGLQKSDLIIIAGETSMGKTSLALTITRHAIEDNSKVAFYSMEMTKEQLAARMISARTRIPANEILYSGNIPSEELRLIDNACGELPGNNLFFDDKSTSNIDSILMSIRMMKLKSDIDGAVVDYLQILNVNSKNTSFSRELAMGDAARRFKNLAKELGIWIIALSQLSRDSNNPEPNLNRLRDSGQIGEAADVVMLIYRPEYYNRSYPAPYDNREEYPIEGTAMIDVAKGRNIGTFKFFLGFDKKTTNFYRTDAISSYTPLTDVADSVEEDAPF